jgi:hypothetical protein
MDVSIEKLLLDCALQETSMTDPTPEIDPTPEESINAEIADLPPDAQVRVNAIADMLRGALMQDEFGETELAMLLVLEEFQGDCEACAHIGESLQ